MRQVALPGLSRLRLSRYWVREIGINEWMVLFLAAGDEREAVGDQLRCRPVSSTRTLAVSLSPLFAHMGVSAPTFSAMADVCKRGKYGSNENGWSAQKWGWRLSVPFLTGHTA